MKSRSLNIGIATSLLLLAASPANAEITNGGGQQLSSRWCLTSLPRGGAPWWDFGRMPCWVVDNIGF